MVCENPTSADTFDISLFLVAIHIAWFHVMFHIELDSDTQPTIQL